MISVIVTGAAGRMGSRLVSLVREAADLRLAGATEHQSHPAIGADVGEVVGCGRMGVPLQDNLKGLLDQADVVLDFSTPAATLGHLRLAAERRCAMVIGTTGFTAEALVELRSRSETIPCVFAPNMSVGVNVLLKVLGEMARALGEDYDIEVIEAHHRLKKDAPSGTALKIAEVLAEATGKKLEDVGVFSRKGLIGERKAGEIGVQTIRAGDIVGDHTVLFGGMGERVEVTHRAQSRDTFAHGALRAARWVVGKPPGLYDMQDVLGLRERR
ncbi:MAG: 4-hydroxy-tetrahydrodipicolinate reductase [Nitrospirales bacterium]